jgi:hypothetical protein
VSETPDPAPSDDRAANVFDRIFPGPAQRDPGMAARLEAIARAAERRAQHTADHQRRPGRSGERRPDRAPSSSAPADGPSPSEATASSDIDRIADLLGEQTEILRAVLDADIAVRDDARATAQNSRTYAIAGTVIAFFTMVAAVVTLVIAFAH